MNSFLIVRVGSLPLDEPEPGWLMMELFLKDPSRCQFTFIR